MKNFLQKIIFIIFLLFPIHVFSCSLPPDILHEFTINTRENPITIEYSLLTWSNLRPKIFKILEGDSQKIHENLEEILEEKILQNANLQFEDQKISLKFLTGTLIGEYEGKEGDYLPEAILTAKYETNIFLNSEGLTHFSLDFYKKTFDHISPLIHPYLITDIQKNTIPKGYLLDENNKFFDWYEGDFVIKTENQEDVEINNFSLVFGKNNENFINPNVEQYTQNISLPIQEKDNSETVNFFAPGNTLKKFFQEKLSWGFAIFGFIIAIISGMAHGLLPGHSKSLLIGYVASGGKIATKEIITIIFSVTISHTVFIVILAMIIIFFQKGTSFSASIVGLIGAIFYIIFGGFFLWKGGKFFFQKPKIGFQKSLNIHGNSCLCCQTNPIKNTILVGSLAGLVPCIDALALFVVAISMGNILYSSGIIVAFSLGIGITLGIIAMSLNSGKNFFHKKGNIFAEKFSHMLTIIAGIFLIIMGMMHFL